ncbi:uncharacterized protein A4U43_C02F19970 [Asparagus officinalis]|uniref:Uncharacterized protein n=1 Tax=Asparagus officinalis TaxID=4686 RepID=A0A5P1FJR3_ASPOF|nr:uncharacterized protein A4U43_C02F19970 [Asparagus officinalis]
MMEATTAGAPPTAAGEGEGPSFGEELLMAELDEFARVGESFECLRHDVAKHFSQSFGISVRILEPKTVAAIQGAISGAPTEVVKFLAPMKSCLLGLEQTGEDGTSRRVRKKSKRHELARKSKRVISKRP